MTLNVGFSNDRFGHEIRLLLAELYSEDPSSPSDQERLYGLLLEMRDVLPEGMGSIADAFEELQGQLLLGSLRSDRSAPAPESLLLSCNELRLHMLSLAHVYSRMEMDFGDVLTNLSQSAGPLVHEASGVSYAHAMDSVVIVLPELGSREVVREVMNSLLRIYDLTPARYDWVLDFSVVTRLPLLFFGSLLRYRERFGKEGRELHLAWVHDDLATVPALTSSRNPFRLERRGGFWFSDERHSIV